MVLGRFICEGRSGRVEVNWEDRGDTKRFHFLQDNVFNHSNDGLNDAMARSLALQLEEAIENISYANEVESNTLLVRTIETITLNQPEAAQMEAA